MESSQPIAGDDNPYRAPTAEEPPGQPEASRSLFGDATLEDERITFLPQETMIRAIGDMQFIKAAAGLLGVALMFFGVLPGFTPSQEQMSRLRTTPEQVRNVGVLTGTLGALISFALGHQLRRLKNWARWILVVLTAFELIAIIRIVVDRSGLVPIDPTARVLSGLAALFRAYVLFQLLVSDSRHVCSAEYRAVVHATRQIRPQWGTRETILVVGYTVLLAVQMLRWI